MRAPFPVAPRLSRHHFSDHETRDHTGEHNLEVTPQLHKICNKLCVVMLQQEKSVDTATLSCRKSNYQKGVLRACTAVCRRCGKVRVRHKAGRRRCYSIAKSGMNTQAGKHIRILAQDAKGNTTWHRLSVRSVPTIVRNILERSKGSWPAFRLQQDKSYYKKSILIRLHNTKYVRLA